MKKQTLAWLMVLVLTLTSLSVYVTATAVSAADATSAFAFNNGKMSKETLRAYCSRAVTLQGFCVENNSPDPIFEEDLRMLQRIGAKYIGRAAFYSWGGNMSWDSIQQHYQIAKERAAAAHKADPEMILQAGVFEIIYVATVNNTPIPAYVFEAFNLPVEKRNFRYDDMVFTSGSYAVNNGFWGSGADSAVPNISKLETRMYFFWQITQYIDAGYESIHLGQTTLMSNNNSSNYKYWDELTAMCRAYAEVSARRGIILFDSHATGGGLKIGDRLILDIQAAPLFPEESMYENGIYKCTINDNKKHPNQWIGNTKGGRHPLGFDIEENFTILEFDNYGGNGKFGVATKNAHYVWGWDDVTWFALQPEEYRNQFLLECDAFLKNNVLDSNGKQQYFLQPACRRVLTGQPVFSFTIDDVDNLDYVMDYLEKEQTSFIVNDDGSFTMTVKKDYRANAQSDACPNGFGQEDAIRQVFLGKNAPENPAYTGCVVPGKTTTATTTKGKTTSTQADTSAGTTDQAVSTTVTTGKSSVAVINTTSTAYPNASGDGDDIPQTESSAPVKDETVSDAEATTSDVTDESAAGLWITLGAAALALIAAAVAVLLVIMRQRANTGAQPTINENEKGL